MPNCTGGKTMASPPPPPPPPPPHPLPRRINSLGKVTANKLRQRTSLETDSILHCTVNVYIVVERSCYMLSTWWRDMWIMSSHKGFNSFRNDGLLIVAQQIQGSFITTRPKQIEHRINIWYFMQVIQKRISVMTKKSNFLFVTSFTLRLHWPLEKFKNQC